MKSRFSWISLLAFSFSSWLAKSSWCSSSSHSNFQCDSSQFSLHSYSWSSSENSENSSKLVSGPSSNSPDSSKLLHRPSLNFPDSSKLFSGSLSSFFSPMSSACFIFSSNSSKLLSGSLSSFFSPMSSACFIFSSNSSKLLSGSLSSFFSSMSSACFIFSLCSVSSSWSFIFLSPAISRLDFFGEIWFSMRSSSRPSALLSPTSSSSLFLGFSSFGSVFFILLSDCGPPFLNVRL